MVKYQIEGDINFYDELYKSIDEKDETNNDNVCLITGNALTDNFVKMVCGHTFNYLPLYYDVVNHKKKYNNMERSLVRSTEIRCPYCRTVQKQLLPYYENLGLEKVHGVNYYDESYAISASSYSGGWHIGNCCYEYKDASNNVVSNCVNKQVALVEIIGKKYCVIHKTRATKEYMMNKKLEIKKKEKEAKQKNKELKMKEKELLKQLKSLEQIHKKNVKVELNVQDNSVIVLQKDMCKQILKTGVNKGKECGCSVFQDNFCKRHYNLLNKNPKVELAENI
jgi:hypothetical protein